jgi:hypothetical protein
MRSPRIKAFGALAVIIGLLFVLTGCGVAKPSSDEVACVYSSKSEGRQFKEKVNPNEDGKDSSEGHIVVTIPTSNRFYGVSRDEAKSDPGAPKFYTAYSEGRVPVTVEGQFRFKFNNVGNLPCEWLSAHGFRNIQGDGTDLGFNVRGDANQPWFLFLNGNFGGTGLTAVTNKTTSYNVLSLAYNDPINADPETGLVPKDKAAGINTWEQFGREVGLEFSNLLEPRLGAKYFCGIDPLKPGVEYPKGYDAKCPPIFFEVFDTKPVNEEIIEGRDSLEATKAKTRNAEAENTLLKKQQATVLENEQIKAKIAHAQASTKQAEAEVTNAECIMFTKQGLDCSAEHKPLPNRGNTTVTVNPDR